VTVTLMGTAIEGLDRYFTTASPLSERTCCLYPGSWFIDSHSEWLAMQKRRDITMAQVEGLEK